MSKVNKSVEAEGSVVVAMTGVEQDLHNLTQRFEKVRSALIQQVEMRKAQLQVQVTQGEQIAVLMKGMNALRQQVSTMALKLADATKDAYMDRLLLAVNELRAEHNIPEGVRVDEALVKARMREHDLAREAKTPMAKAPAAEEALDF